MPKEWLPRRPRGGDVTAHARGRSSSGGAERQQRTDSLDNQEIRDRVRLPVNEMLSFPVIYRVMDPKPVSQWQSYPSLQMGFEVWTTQTVPALVHIIESDNYNRG